MVSSLGFFSVNKLLVAVIVIWILVIFLLSNPLFKKNEEYTPFNDNTELILARINRATTELNSLKNQNKELRQVLEKLRISNNLDNNVLNDLIKHENQIQSQSAFFNNNHLVSNVIYDFNELKLYVENQLSLKKEDEKLIKEQFLNLEHQLNLINERDYDWKKEELNKLRSFVQNTIKNLQNPDDCNKAKKLVCQLNKGCGFGCQIHHVIYCLVVSLALNRTMILDTKFWRYAPANQLKRLNLGIKSGWNLVFENLSESCLEANGDSKSSFVDSNDSIQVINLPIIDAISRKPNYFPLSLPSQISNSLVKLHKNPYAWFYGQLADYILRPSEEMEKFLSKSENKFNFQSPIVGIQVRRTDKIGTEASFHKLSEYMDHVENYFKKLEYINKKNGLEKSIIKRVYLATDDQNIWQEAKNNYASKGYIFLGDEKIAETAQLLKRYSIQSLKNVILDINFLSKCDYIVCTFSSQVCRLAYELMQANNPDFKLNSKKVDYSQEFYSLDDIYYFGGQRPHNLVAKMDHETSLEKHISFKKGDLIGIAGDHWNGFSLGLNKRTNKKGLFPSFKTEEAIETFPFKAFNN